MVVSQGVSEHVTELEESPDDRCGYVHDLSTLDGVGPACCYRPSWKDGEACIWHSETDDPPNELYEELVPQPGERLDGATIPHIELVDKDWFEACTLIGARFDDTVVRGSSFVGADLREAVFDNVDARHADFSDADIRGGSYTSVDFRDATFVNARIAQAAMTNTRVNRETDFGDVSRGEREFMEASSQTEYREWAEAAVWTYRTIHSLYVDNALPLEARRFYYREKDMRRRLAWKMGHYVQALKAEGSRWVTGYGMNPYRVVGSAAVVILVCAFLFPLTGGIEETSGETSIIWSIDHLGQSIDFLVFIYLKSIYFSIITFTTLGYGDIRPVGNMARAIAGIESLLGALLTAMLVFVLSRRIS